ncbi:MAG: menaquinone biosynthesis protein [Thermodesulfobacteriota bacterium]|nr:menaquinone biosynthesis protein [Thermodesulfobacteriota bacterium]
MQLKIGHIDYLNCVPFFHYLKECGFNGTIVKGVPSVLNKMLAQGQLDVSPSSSFEYARSYQDYLLLPGLSISALHAVKSVFLFSPIPIEQLKGRRIYLTGESATSVNLLKVLLSEFYGWDQVSCLVPQQPVEVLLQQGEPVLLIGDRALMVANAEDAGQRFQYDLAELWRHHTGLPFVFALWIVRRKAFATLTEELNQLQQQLIASHQMAFGNLDVLAAQTRQRDWINTKQLVDYWQSISYRLDDHHLEGLRLFFKLCVTYEYLSEMPKINFVDFNCQ